MAPAQQRPSLAITFWTSRLLPMLGAILLLRVAFQEHTNMRSNPRSGLIAAAVPSFARHGHTSGIDLSWHAPNSTAINDLTQVIEGSGIYGFVYNSSDVPVDQYGVYNWCNMPHVRKTEYKKPSSEYRLQYVEVVSRGWLQICPSLLT